MLLYFVPWLQILKIVSSYEWTDDHWEQVQHTPETNSRLVSIALSSRNMHRSSEKMEMEVEVMVVPAPQRYSTAHKTTGEVAEIYVSRIRGARAANIQCNRLANANCVLAAESQG